MTNNSASAIHKDQQEYVDAIGEKMGVVLAQTFVESIRNLGYRSTGTAVDENVDNSLEAGADNIHISFGFADGSKKPDCLAIIDDGAGMVPKMIRAAVVWGGTHRHDSRALFGRFGYGLPSSAVSQGRSFTVWSRVDDGPFYKVTMDLDGIRDGEYTKDGEITIPDPSEGDLPDFVREYADKSFPGGTEAVRTAVIWEKLDRIDYKRVGELENHLLETLGLTYRNQLRAKSLVVNGKSVGAVDPLFLTEGAKFYDEDDEQAQEIEPIVISWKDKETGESHPIRVRLSLLSPTFGSIDKQKNAVGRNANKRFGVIKETNGLIVLRNGRQIDVVRYGLPIQFQTNDRYVKVEVDFPAVMDELFGVTTHKQQINLDKRVIDMLSEHGVWKTVSQVRARNTEARADHTRAMDPITQGDIKRPSERAMEEAAKMDPAAPPSKVRDEKVEETKEKAIKDLVERGISVDEAAKAVEEAAVKRPFRVEIEKLPDGPFFRVEWRGGQTALLINRAHSFYTEVYAAVPGPDGARIRQALEVLLFVIGKCELDANDERQLFYQSERLEWSKRLTLSLAKLSEYIGGDDDRQEADEALEVGVETGAKGAKEPA